MSRAPRLGPRPLPLQLANAMLLWQSARAGWTMWNAGWPIWSAEFRGRADRLAEDLGETPPPDFVAALDRELTHRAAGLADAIAAYRRHPYRRDLAEPPALWQEGTTRLLDYASGGGRPILVVPSLINRATILDLTAERSLLRFLATRGWRPLLVDWGEPGDAERRFGLDDYVAGRLDRAFTAARALAGEALTVLGYCMGGVLALALALRRQDETSGLALLATPWDFHADPAAARTVAALAEPLRLAWGPLGEVPADIVQSLFVGGSPFEVVRKFARFATLDPDGDAARQFVAIEDWANDGVAVSLPLVHDCFSLWYGENLPARGAWTVAGEPVLPGRYRRPTLVIIAERDRLIPKESALALARALVAPTIVEADGGHIGMVVGDAAPATTWAELAAWLERLGS